MELPGGGGRWLSLGCPSRENSGLGRGAREPGSHTPAPSLKPSWGPTVSWGMRQPVSESRRGFSSWAQARTAPWCHQGWQRDPGPCTSRLAARRIRRASFLAVGPGPRPLTFWGPVSLRGLGKSLARPRCSLKAAPASSISPYILEGALQGGPGRAREQERGPHPIIDKEAPVQGVDVVTATRQLLQPSEGHPPQHSYPGERAVPPGDRKSTPFPCKGLYFARTFWGYLPHIPS